MSKKVIKMNESQLKGMISESVKGVLSELDWKTYMNAGKKRLTKPYNEKSKNGFDSIRKAGEEFDKEYGYNANDRWFDHPEKQGITRTYGVPHGLFNNAKDVRMQVKTDVSKPNSSGLFKGRTLTYDPKYKYADMNQYWANDHSPERVENDFYNGSGINQNEEPLLAYLVKHNHDRAKEEVDNYENGNYEYQKGKGWTKKIDEGKYSNNKPFFHGGVRDVKPGEKAFKHTNPGADEKALEKHNARLDKHLPDIMKPDKLKAREAQIKSSKRGGMPRENFKDTLEGKLKNKKQEKYKQVSESDLHRIVKESVQRVLMEDYFASEEPYYVENPYRNDRGFCEWFQKLTFKPQEYDVMNKLSGQQWAKLYKQYQKDIEQNRIENEFRNWKNPSMIRKPDGTEVYYTDNGQGYTMGPDGWVPYNQQ